MEYFNDKQGPPLPCECFFSKHNISWFDLEIVGNFDSFNILPTYYGLQPIT